MNKKTYISPVINVVMIQQTQMLCQSNQTSNYGSTYGFRNEKSNSEGFSWGEVDEDDEIR